MGVSDPQQRRVFGEWAFEKLFFIKKLSLTIKHIFGGTDTLISKIPCLADEQSQASNTRAINPEKSTVWCSLWSGGITSLRMKMRIKILLMLLLISSCLLPKMHELNLIDMWLQQDDATYHTAQETMNLLSNELGELFISRFESVNWRHRSLNWTTFCEDTSNLLCVVSPHYHYVTRSCYF